VLIQAVQKLFVAIFNEAAFFAFNQRRAQLPYPDFMFLQEPQTSPHDFAGTCIATFVELLSYKSLEVAPNAYSGPS